MENKITRVAILISKQEILNANILIVDDQQVNILLLEELLHEVGYRHLSSTMDPFSVCAMHHDNHYDLIILDLKMPGMDGFEVMEELEKVRSEDYLPILVITAQPSLKLRALQSGAKDFIAKPFDLVEAQTRIHNMLEVRLLNKNINKNNKILEIIVQERTAELRKSEATFRRLTELTSDWYWEQDQNGNFTKTFGPVFEMLGIKDDDLQGIVRDNLGDRWKESERVILEANLANKTPFLDFVYSRTRSDGSRHYFMVSGEPMFNQSGHFSGYRGSGKEVTETMFPAHAAKKHHSHH